MVVFMLKIRLLVGCAPRLTKFRTSLLWVCVFLLSFSTAVDATNNKGMLETRYSIMSMKAATALLVDAIAVNDKLVAVGTRGHILVSQDGGKNWKQAKVPTQNLITGVYFANEKDGWAVGHEAVVLHTSDGGENWDFQYGAPYMPEGVDVPNSPSDEMMNDSAEDEYFMDRSGSPLLDVWFKNEKEGFAVGAYGYFLHTDDGGETWADWSGRLGNEDGWHLNAIVSPDDELIYVAGEKGVLFRSTDGGETWIALKSPYDGSFFGMVVGPGTNEALVFGLQGHIFKTSDRGDSWREIETANQNGLMAATLVGKHGIIVVGNGGVMMFSNDGGDSFVKHVTDDRNSIAGIVQVDGDKLLLVGQGGVKLATPNKSLTSLNQ
ncbi:MAG: hypothetical protein COA99_05005 [Moraxellaceae bacterium]|nr:MAG: hypothetical protein COA99_05005 [Moraxellaceae bacterium]